VGVKSGAAFPLPKSSTARGEETSPYHCRRISACRNARTRHHDMTSLHRLQEMLDSTLANLAAVCDPLLDRLAKMKPDQDA
jgi:hypothetical protein